METKAPVHKFWISLVENQLKFKNLIMLILAVITALSIYAISTRLQIVTNFFELYPPKHEYIKLYKEYRKMFGSANVLTIIIRRTDGKDVYNTDTLKKLDTLTRGILTVPGINPLQVVSATHPKTKQIRLNPSGIGVFPLAWPSVGYPKTPELCQTFKDSAYKAPGVKGILISLDDKSAVVNAGFWEEGLNFKRLFRMVNELCDSVNDDTHETIVTGYPMLYAWLDFYKVEIMIVLLSTLSAMILLLIVYFRTIRGILIPVISGTLSAIWGLGFAAVMGFNVDPLLLVVPVLLSARALSHSCQCLERYNQEYMISGGQMKESIVKAYSSLYPPAMLAIVTDGLGVLTICIATIPLMQKLAYVSSFWIISIFVSVSILNPILIPFLPQPKLDALDSSADEKTGMGSILQKIYEQFTGIIQNASGPGFKWIVFAFILILVIPGGIFTGTNLKIGDSSAGGAILYPDHPFNEGSRILNRDFVGESRLIVIVEGKEKEAIKTQQVLQVMEKLGTFMTEKIETVGGTLSMTDTVRGINMMYHDGCPKWGIIPNKKRMIGQMFFLLSSGMSPGEFDRFVSLPNYQNSNVTGFLRNYNHQIIKDAITDIKKFAKPINSDPDSKVNIKLAGGILGIMAAVNEEVEWSYWAILIVIFTVTFMLCLITYRSFKAALILILPLYASQVLCELVMMYLHIDLNIDSLPVAAIGVGVGIDYGIYLLSRLKEECALTEDFEKAKLIALATTGKIIIFTALTTATGTMFWLFSTLKFQAEMGLLILLLMTFNMIGALVFIPALSSILKPNFVLNMGQGFGEQAA